ncbi:MAG: HAD family hydrolase [Dehalococcoidia bacterium]|nr:MAG: HAD family hydrolase [Dehalococcoidia bacterium]
MDDTLYDEKDYCQSGFLEVSKFLASEKDRFAQKEYFAAIWKQFELEHYNNTFNLALDDLGVDYDKAFLQKLVSIYRNHSPAIELPVESLQILEEFHKKYKLGLLTDGFLPAQRLKVESLGITKYFSCIVYTEEIGREFWKPSSAGFEKVLASLQARASNSVYVGDNAEKDFIGPNELGIKTVQILRKNRIHKNPPANESSKPGFKIGEFSELRELLMRI